MATKMADKMYGNAPKMERDEEDGKVKVKKSDKAEDKEAVTEGGAESEGVDVHARHAVERMNLHHAHQHAHHAHDAGKGGDKHDLHKRHQEELKALHSMHEKEMSGEKK